MSIPLDTEIENSVHFRHMEKESVKVSGDLLKTLRKIADRDGMILGRLIERLIRAGMAVENIK